MRLAVKLLFVLKRSPKYVALADFEDRVLNLVDFNDLSVPQQMRHFLTVWVFGYTDCALLLSFGWHFGLAEDEAGFVLVDGKVILVGEHSEYPVGILKGLI